MADHPFGITVPYVESFLYSKFPDPDQILAEIDAFGKRNGVPIVGPLVGRFLHLLVRACKPSSAFEIGTAIGYSTIWLASALPQSSRLTTIELDQERAGIAKKNLERARLTSKVTLLVGDATKLVPRIQDYFDFIFLDTEKTLYPRLLPDLLERLNVGGFLVADNTLWGGRVATKDNSRETAAIREFDNKIIRDKRLFTVIVPIRDGVSLSLKVQD